MGSRPIKSIERLQNEQRQMIYQKWKYDIIQCQITFDDIEEKENETILDNLIDEDCQSAIEK